MNPNLQGVLIVHACFTLSRATVEKRLSSFELEQPTWQEDGAYSSTCLDIQVDYQRAMDIIDSLSAVAKIRFELVLFGTQGFTGERWVWSPALGMGSSQIDTAGNHLIGEGRINALLREGADNPLKIERLIRKLLLSEWDNEFEELREQNLSQRRRLNRVG